MVELAPAFLFSQAFFKLFKNLTITSLVVFMLLHYVILFDFMIVCLTKL